MIGCVQAVRDENLDAANLRLPSSTSSGDDPRMLSTIDATLGTLSSTDSATATSMLLRRDREGRSFVVCTTWLINALIRAGHGGAPDVSEPSCTCKSSRPLRRRSSRRPGPIRATSRSRSHRSVSSTPPSRLLTQGRSARSAAPRAAAMRRTRRRGQTHRVRRRVTTVKEMARDRAPKAIRPAIQSGIRRRGLGSACAASDIGGRSRTRTFFADEAAGYSVSPSRTARGACPRGCCEKMAIRPWRRPRGSAFLD